MILDGAAVARRLQGEIQERVAAFVARSGVQPTLATVLVGEDPASHVYVGNKRRTCERLGLRSLHHGLPADTDQATLMALVDALNADPSVHGILVQLPLPRGLDADAIIERIDPRKDVDGFHPENVGRLALKRPRFTPCTPTGVMRLLAETGLPVAGKRATVVGRSNIVGLPAALMLLHAHATVRIVHSRTSAADLEAAVREAEILVVGVGIPGFVDGAHVRPGAAVIDVGVNRLAPTEAHPKGRLVGDVGFDAAAERAAWITPVPGGVGPMTITLLMENTLRAAEAAVGGVW